jgi:predicted dienelactone hydrolase
MLPAADIVTFPNGEITLHGVLYKPEGTGPFPAVVYNHGSAPGMLSKEAFDVLGPAFASHGWVFFGPYRRGQGSSASAGPYIGDQIAAAEKNGGVSAGADPFDYLNQLQRHAEEVKQTRSEWMPWNYRATLARTGALLNAHRID